MIKFGEWLPDLPSYQNSGVTVAKNVIPSASGYLPFPSLSAGTSALDGGVLGAFAARNDAANAYVFAGDSGKLYSHNDGTWTDVSKSGGYSVSSGWEFAKWGEKIIATSDGTDPQIITMGGTSFADLSGTPPKASHLGVVGDFVVLGNTSTGTPSGNNVLFWSDINDETNWSTGQSDFQEIQGGGGRIQKVIGGEYGVVFQEYAIQRMDYVGPPTIFNIKEVETGRGTRAPRSVVRFGNAIYYLGHDDFYVFDGSRSTALGVNKIADTFFSDVNKHALEKVSSAVDVTNRVIAWAYPSGASTVCDKILIYHWPTGRWSQAEVDTDLIFSTVGQAYTLEGLDSLGNLDNLPVSSLDSDSLIGGALSMAGFNHSHQLGTFDGAGMSAQIVTGEVELNEGQRATVTRIRPLVDGATATIKIGHRSRLQDTVSWSQSASVNDAGFCPVRVNNRYMQFQVDIDGSNFKHAIAIEINAKPRGFR